jgi:very-short-patch-repair endonuclease
LTYPVVKIPPLIANANKYSNKITVASDDRSSSVGLKTLPAKHSSRIEILYSTGYLLLFFSATIFIIASFINLAWIPYSSIVFLLGIININVAELLVSKYKPQLYHSPKIHSYKHNEIVDSESEFSWQTLLEGKVLRYGNVAQAQTGVSETYFQRYLRKYFDDFLHPGYEFKVNDKITYSSDFTLILPIGIGLIIEVDEPYEGRSKKPHHCTDDGKDEYRDKFFLKGNWIVVRFSEFQVCAYPDECCYVIARTLDRIDSRYNFGKSFVGISNLPLDSRWDKRQAKLMASQDYRLKYLEKYNIYTRKRSSESRVCDN